jgi:bla regulator protein blaR1
MTVPDFSLLENHLWQSTLCVLAVWLLTFAFQRSRAAVRYWLWFAASAKFLVPFSLLVGIGSWLGWRTVPAAMQPEWSAVIVDIGHPFAPAAPAAAALRASPPHSILAIPIALFGIWLCGFTVTMTLWIRSWRNLRLLKRGATPLGLDLPIPAMTTPSLVEPGVFGIWRPVLLLPEGIADRLTGAQLGAIAAHEMCHVRRRDNLSAAIHMAAEAIFWFHPLLWWIQTRLVDERERACDEEVLRMGGEREAYAEGILNVCKFYVEGPLCCASGIGASDLKKRIVRILTEHLGDALSFRRKLLLVAVAIVAALGPVAFGLLNTPRAGAQSQQLSTAMLPSFEVASIKPDRSESGSRYIRLNDPSRFSATNIPAKNLIQFAYHVHPFQISGGPGWIESQGYDIEAKVDDTVAKDLQKLPPEQRMDQFRLMLRSLLADRFNLKLSPDTKEMPVFALVVAKDGTKLTATADTPSNEQRFPGMLISPGKLTAREAPINFLAEALGEMPELGGRLVLDETGLKGRYDFTLEWAAERPASPAGAPAGDQLSGNAPPPPDPSAPSIFTGIQEQLGLKLEPTKGPVEILAIDRIEKPSEN